MAILTFGAKIEHTSDDIVKECLEEEVRDENGNVFELIVLRSLKELSENTSSQGYEDTFIFADERPVRITHRKPGRIQWRKQRMGFPKGELAKTEHNMRTLAANFKFPNFKILNKDIEAEVSAMHDELWEKMTPDERRLEELMIKGASMASLPESYYKEYDELVKKIREASGRVGDVAVDAQGKTAEEVRQATPYAKPKKVVKETKAFQALAVAKKEYSYIELMDNSMKTFAIKAIARKEFGLTPGPSETKKEVVDMIIAEQEKRNQTAAPKEEKLLEVTG